MSSTDRHPLPPAVVTQTPTQIQERSQKARNVFGRRGRSWAIVIAGQVVLVGAILAVWQWLAVSGTVNPLFIGEPVKIFQRLFVQLGIVQDSAAAVSTTIWPDVSSTLQGWFYGWILASITAIIVAFLVTRIAVIRNIIEPLTVAINGLPRIAFAPLFVLWFGIGVTGKVAMSFSIAFFVVFANTVAAIDGVDRDLALLAKVIGATERQTFTKFVFPGAIPTIFAGLELAAIFAMLGTVASELLAGSQGLGVKLALFGAQFQTNDYFATLTVLGVITLAITQILRMIRRRALRWKLLDDAAN